MNKTSVRKRIWKAFYRFAGAALITVLFINGHTSDTFAKGAALVSGDRETAAVGDSYKVTVNVRNDQTDEVAPRVSVEYDANRLSFVGCTGEYDGGAGGLIVLGQGDYTIEFNVLSGGQANVVVTAVFNGDGSTEQKLTASLFVEGEDTAGTPEENVMEGEEPESFSVDGELIDAGNGLMVAAAIPDQLMPSVGFSKTTVSYKGSSVEAAQFDKGNIVLLFVTDGNGDNGVFKSLNQADESLGDFLMIPGAEGRFIIPLNAGEGIDVPDNFEQIIFEWKDNTNNMTFEAYQCTGSEMDDADAANDDFFIIYAMSSDGNTGWYMYDKVENTYQRYVSTVKGEKSGDASDEGLISRVIRAGDPSGDGGINMVIVVLIIIAVLFVALVVAVIIMGIKLKEFNSYEYIDEDEDDENVENAENTGFQMGGMPLGAGSQAILMAGMSDISTMPEKYEQPAEPDESEDAEEPEEAVNPEEPDEPEEALEAEESDEPEEAEESEDEAEPEDEAESDDAEESDDTVEKDDNPDEEEAAEQEESNLPDEMPKSKNIYEQFKLEDEARGNIPEEFVVRKRQAPEKPQAPVRPQAPERPQAPLRPQAPARRDEFEQERLERARYERYGDVSAVEDEYMGGNGQLQDEDMFSPRDRRPSRLDKKAMKQEEKARKKEQKRLKKEFGEFGPVDWQSWQDAVEGGEKTAAMASRNASRSIDDEEPVRRPEPRREEPVRRPEPRREEPVRRPEPRREEPVRRPEPRREEPVRRPEPRREGPVRRPEPHREEPVRRPEPRREEPVRRPEPRREEPVRRPEPRREEPVRRPEQGRQNPMDMMRNIPANDNKAPVQAKPVQQFDFDDDFEFEFLSLDDDDI